MACYKVRFYLMTFYSAMFADLLYWHIFYSLIKTFNLIPMYPQSVSVCPLIAVGMLLLLLLVYISISIITQHMPLWLPSKLDTHAHTHARAHAHTHTHTHSEDVPWLSQSSSLKASHSSL